MSTELKDYVASLPLATSAEVASAGDAAILIGTQLKRFTVNLFASRRTADLNVLPGSEYADWINCIGSSGNEYKIAAKHLTRASAGIIDPSLPPYNCRLDAQKAKSVGFTSGSNVYTTADAVFTADDIGKIAAVSNATAAGPAFGYIGAVLSSTSIRLYSDAGFTTPINASVTHTAEEIIWGTDDTTGMQNAFDAAERVGIWNYGGAVAINGLALVTSLRFGSIAVVGRSPTATGFMFLPVNAGTGPCFADKNTGVYGSTYKPTNYSIINIGLFGQRFTNYYNEFRHLFQVRGGLFANFPTGAPYARIENVDMWGARWDNFHANPGAFAGFMNNIRSYGAGQVGLYVAFWDLNATNWHAEGNGGAGVISAMTGANVAAVRTSYNGANGGLINVYGNYWPNQYGANWTELGYGNTVTNLRMQESWGHSLYIGNVDPSGAYSGHGSKNSFQLGTFDDTGNIVPAHSGNATRLPTVRAMVAIEGNTCINNSVTLVHGSGQVFPTNYATNGYYDSGNPSNNVVTLDTPGITNSTGDWYSGQSAASPGPWYHTSASSIATRGNVVTINGSAAP